MSKNKEKSCSNFNLKVKTHSTSKTQVSGFEYIPDSSINILIFCFSFREGRGNAHLTGNYKRIGDVVLHNFDSVTTEYYLRYVDTHGLILEKLERVLSDPNASPGHFRFAQVFRDFESQKVCYLPITTLILKPLHRILHYELLLERKLNFTKYIGICIIAKRNSN